MSETEPSVEDFLDEAAAQRAKDAGIEPPAKVEDKGKSTKPEPGKDDAGASDGGEDEGEELEASEDDDSQDGASKDEDEGEKPKAKPQSRAQKRIRQLTRERDLTKEMLARRDAELAAFARLAEQNSQAQKPEPKAEVAAKNDPPKQEDFDDYAKYVAELSAWSAGQAVEARLAADNQNRAQAQKQAKADAFQTQRVDAAKGVFAKGSEEFDDFAEIAGAEFPVTDAMTDAISASEEGHKVLYHLGNNPEEAERIAKLSPVAQIREVAMIEAGLIPSKGGAKPKKAAKKQTSASEPMKPVKAGGAPNNFDPDECSMDAYMDDYHRQRKEGRF